MTKMWIAIIVCGLAALSSCSSCTDGAANNVPVCDGGICVDAGTNNGVNNGSNNGINNGQNNGAAQFVSIRIEPPSATLQATDGATPTQDFEVIGTRDDGSEAPFLAATFELDVETTGRIDEANGTFTANGVIGGTAIVTAKPAIAGIEPAQAAVTVQIIHTVMGPGAPADADTRFASPVDDPANAATLVYPLEGAVMPQNVYPADIQWMNGAAGDLFRITMAKANVKVTAYIVHSGDGFGNHWLPDLAGWRSLAQTEPDADARITVDRWVDAAQTAYSSAPVHIRFARAALSGTVYYWDIGAGRIVRIDDGTGQGVSFMPTPPPDAGGTQCVGCHSVSNSGQFMVGRLGGGDNVGTVFDLTQDLSGNPPPTMWPLDPVNGPRWWFSTWSPADDRIIVTKSEPNGGLDMMDPFTGLSVAPVAGSLPTNNVTHPAWAPDNSLVAYVSNINAWGGAFSAGDLSVLPVTGADSFGTPQVIVPGTAPSALGAAISYPSWTPDAQRIAFAHGTGGRSESDQAALYVANRDGTGITRLDKANGGPDTTLNFQPNFSPFDQGGYFWLMFLSRRDYGNGEVGTLGSGRQQLWVTAISKTAAGDPSEVAYWLPGQNTASMNIAGYWAPRPCRPDGSDCSVGSECCSGTCAPDQSGALVCSPPPPDRCREEFETCNTTADCCEGKDLICIDNVCQHVVN